VEEGWCIAQGAGDHLLCKSWRRAPGVEIQADAQLNDGMPVSCELGWFGAQDIKVSYRLAGTQWNIERSINGSAVKHFVLDAQKATHLLFPLMRIYTGPLIARILQLGGEAHVVVPDITEPDNSNNLLKPRCSSRKARLLDAAAELELDGKLYLCRQCEYTGDQYEAGSLFWLGNNNRLLRYCWQQGKDQQWEVSLSA
jgi:hypothetical protein